MNVAALYQQHTAHNATHPQQTLTIEIWQLPFLSCLTPLYNQTLEVQHIQQQLKMKAK
jgi:hypothetical protein